MLRAERLLTNQVSELRGSPSTSLPVPDPLTSPSMERVTCVVSKSTFSFNGNSFDDKNKPELLELSATMENKETDSLLA